jgi:hypothetical protein
VNTSFKNLVEEQLLLSEMPYVLVDKNDKRFDLEIEKFVSSSDLEGFINKIKQILKGQKLSDKYNNIVELKTSSDVKSFIENLKRDPTMPLTLWKLFIHWISSTVSEKDAQSN